MPQNAGNGSSAVYRDTLAISGGTTGVIASIENLAKFDADVWIHRAWLVVSAGAAAAATNCTIDVGIGDSISDTADSRANDILDGIDVEAGTVTLNVALDSIALDIAGATGLATPILFPRGDFLLVHVATGDATDFVAELHYEYSFA